MNGIYSRSAGVIILPKSGDGPYSIFDFVNGNQIDPLQAMYSFSTVNDWEEIKKPVNETLEAYAIRRYWEGRVASMVQLAIAGLERSLEKEVLKYSEELLLTRDLVRKTIDSLLVAPLKNPQAVQELTERSISSGFTTVASVLHELGRLQPLISKCSENWLGLDESLFREVSESKESCWLALVDGVGLFQLLQANDRKDFESKWTLGLFTFQDKQTLLGMRQVGREMARLLYPSADKVEVGTMSIEAELDDVSSNLQEFEQYSPETYDQVKKQISSIVLAVSRGQETKAKVFLTELLHFQTTLSGQKSYAVKSLCNIAKQCANLGRTDFELRCLTEALELDNSDPWTLIQYGNYLKRAGRYSEAIECFQLAEEGGENRVAHSSIADVYSEQEEFEIAIEVYKSITNWQNAPEILTAIADNVRKMGNYDEALLLYNDLFGSPLLEASDAEETRLRIQVGIAEIRKRQGRFKDALSCYREILRQGRAPEHEVRYYKLGLCNVLKLMEEYEEAYSIVEEVIKAYPFAMEARFLRGSILGLIGDEITGLKDLQISHDQLNRQEWLIPYYRGLLLLKLREYSNAKKELIDKISDTVVSGEQKAIQRMAAALWFLSKNETYEADGLLSQIPSLHDCHAQYLFFVLQLHSAALKSDKRRVDWLRSKIAEIDIVDATLDKAILAIEQGNFSMALSLETDALLKRAA